MSNYDDDDYDAEAWLVTFTNKVRAERNAEIRAAKTGKQICDYSDDPGFAIPPCETAE